MSKSETATKVYTRAGDKGKTGLVGGKRVSKADARLEAYGTVDELNSVIGLLAAQLSIDLRAGAFAAALEDLQSTLKGIQHQLFNVGSRLACEDEKIRVALPEVSEHRIIHLETLMDRYSERLTPLKNFILPGGSLSASYAHLARTVCRRAERICVSLAQNESVDSNVISYLNRLSDYFFVLARHINRIMGIDEPIWKPDAT